MNGHQLLPCFARRGPYKVVRGRRQAGGGSWEDGGQAKVSEVGFGGRRRRHGGGEVELVPIFAGGLGEAIRFWSWMEMGRGGGQRDKLRGKGGFWKHGVTRGGQGRIRLLDGWTEI